MIGAGTFWKCFFTFCLFARVIWLCRFVQVLFCNVVVVVAVFPVCLFTAVMWLGAGVYCNVFFPVCLFTAVMWLGVSVVEFFATWYLCLDS